MNPMKYPQSYLALEAAQFDRQPRMAPPLTWDDREAEQIPSYEQTAISPDPLIDLGAGFSGGFGANIMRKGLSSALRSGIAATLAEYPIGLATAGAANIDPRLAMPVSIMGGMASGPTFERALSNAMAGKAHPVRTARRALGNAMGQVDAWHGSPHVWPPEPGHPLGRARLDKIGTGEGAQAFGYGLYFADMEGVAKHYAKKLSEDMQFDALSQKENKTIPAWVKQRITRTEDIDEFIKDWHERIKSAELMIENSSQPWLYEGNKAGHIEIIKALEKLKKSNNLSAKKGNVYKATLHKGKNPSEYVYLDWDKPFTENILSNIEKISVQDGVTIGQKKAKTQHDKIIKKYGSLKKLLHEVSKKNPDAIADREKINTLYRPIEGIYKAKNGQQLYQNLSKILGSDKEASLFLKRAGIDGIRYPAGSLSGGSGQGKNYVVFDENAITIEERKALSR
jgi:hypothetical protein